VAQENIKLLQKFTKNSRKTKTYTHRLH